MPVVYGWIPLQTRVSSVVICGHRGTAVVLCPDTSCNNYVTTRILFFQHNGNWLLICILIHCILTDIGSIQRFSGV